MDNKAPAGTTPVHILAVGREHAILEVIQRLINAHEGWSAGIAETETAAIEAFRAQKWDIVFISAGFSAAEEESLRQKLNTIDPETVVTRHYGGGSGLLENEILGIINRKQ